jgi:hypothetical protein
MSSPQAVLQQLSQHVEGHTSQDTYQVIFDWAASKLKEEVSPFARIYLARPSEKATSCLSVSLHELQAIVRRDAQSAAMAIQGGR